MADDRQQSTTTTDKEKGSPRPTPEVGRTAENARGKTIIHALVVGINDYQGSINPLRGCIRDVNLVVRYLRKKFGASDHTPEVKTFKSSKSDNYIETHGHLNLKVLTNKEATYENVMEAFDSHLANKEATGDNSFWFHFSGHGSEQFTAEEFFAPEDGSPSFEPNGKDQTLVCYNPDGAQTGIFIADKELAWMINNIHKKVPAKEKLNPHILISLDCCHSGSGTRDFMEDEDFQTRSHEHIDGTRADGIAEGKARSFDSYCKWKEDQVGEYTRMKNAGKLEIPHSRHMLLAACSNTEKAGDTFSGGFFTRSLIENLEAKHENAEDINYNDLFTLTRARAQFYRFEQTAQFEPIFGFNTNTAFLEGFEFGETKQYEVFPDGDVWSVKCGAIHGLPSSPEEARSLNQSDAEEPTDILMKIFRFSNNEKILMGHAVVDSVGFQDSSLWLLDDMLDEDSNPKLKKKPDPLGQGDVDISAELYKAEIANLPVQPQYLDLRYVPSDSNATEPTAEALQAIKLLKEKWNVEIANGDVKLNNLNILLTEQGAEKLASAEIRVDEVGTYQLWDKHRDRSWHRFPIPSEDIDELDVVFIVKKNLNIMARWKRLMALENKGSKLQSAFDLEVLTMDYPLWKDTGKIDINKNNLPLLSTKMKVHKSNEVIIYGNEETFFNPTNTRAHRNIRNVFKKDSTIYGIRINSHQTDLYFYLYAMDQDHCSIEAYTRITPKLEKVTEGHLIKMPAILKFDGQAKEETALLKLFVTTTPIENIKILEQGGFDNTRGEEEFGEGSTSTDDWFSTTISVKMVKQEHTISDTPVQLSSGITIQPHDGVRAKLNLATTETGSRSLDPKNKLAGFERIEGMQMLDFGSNTRSLGRRNVIELTDIEVGESADLEANPLKINIDDHLAENEALLPIAFDGQHFRVIGDAHNDENGKIQVNIRDLPSARTTFDEDGEPIPNPFGEGDGDRSLFRAAKMAFLKWRASGDEDKQKEINQLRWIEYKDDNTFERHDTNIKAKVKNADNILMVIHGIIGNTDDMVKCLAEIKDDNGVAIKDKYDLVLSYDYENLTRPIEETAKRLKEDLEAAGITAAKGKCLTILAHSMGGLVSRYFIENKELNGDAVMKHLIMAGTPNAGSPFGKIPGGVEFAKNMLDIGLNFMSNIIPVAGLALKGLRLLSGGLKKADTATQALVSLDQMNPGSEFITQLNDPEACNPTTPYTVLAGNVELYNPTGSGFSGFVERSTIWVGDVANPDEHDIAVALSSIRNEEVWKARNQEATIETVACHHLNYFTFEAGRNALASAFLGKKKAPLAQNPPTDNQGSTDNQGAPQNPPVEPQEPANNPVDPPQNPLIITETKGPVQVQVTVNLQLPSQLTLKDQEQVQVQVQVNIQEPEEE